MKIFIVDDDEVAVKLLSLFLQDEGECQAANGSEEAIEAIKTAMEQGKPYELIFLDIIMPVTSGIETLKTIREMEQSTFNISKKRATIIMVSALDDIKTIQKSFNALCDGYLTKPVQKKYLLEKMHDIKMRSTS